MKRNFSLKLKTIGQDHCTFIQKIRISEIYLSLVTLPGLFTTSFKETGCSHEVIHQQCKKPNNGDNDGEHHGEPDDDEGVLVQNMLRNLTYKLMGVGDHMFDILSSLVHFAESERREKSVAGFRELATS